MNKLTIIRGLPGSGKTTLARKLLSSKTNTRHFEADMYFENNGVYEFDRNKLNGAHKWCLIQTMLSLIHGFDVIVSNTFTTKKELQPYLDITSAGTVELEVIECTDSYGSIHDVPQSTIDKMRERWEKI